MSATDHLAKAKDYIAKGEDYYRKAADEIMAAQDEDPTLGYREIGRGIGRSDKWCRTLVQWRTSAEAASVTPFAREAGESERKDAEAARRTLKSPEQRKQVIASLDSEQIEEVIQEAHGVAMDRIQARNAEKATTQSAGAIMGGDAYDPAESWADKHLIRVRQDAHLLRLQVEKWGLVLGSLDEAQAFEYIQEAERNIAEVRAALQERIADREQATV